MDILPCSIYQDHLTVCASVGMWFCGWNLYELTMISFENQQLDLSICVCFAEQKCNDPCNFHFIIKSICCTKIYPKAITFFVENSQQWRYNSNWYEKSGRLRKMAAQANMKRFHNVHTQKLIFCSLRQVYKTILFWEIEASSS